MSLIKLDTDLLIGSLGDQRKQMNDSVIDLISVVARDLQNSGDNNVLVEQTIEECKKYQATYNNMMESMSAAMEDMAQVVDLSEYMARRASVGEVQNKDLGFENSKIDIRSRLI